MDETTICGRAARARLHVLPPDRFSSRPRSALTLRTLGGLKTEEIARAFLVPRRDDGRSGSSGPSGRSRPPGIPFRVPPDHLLPERLACWYLAVVYLIFNEGYGGRVDLAAEAIRLGRALAELMPDEPEVHGLLALMLMNDARRDARFADGTIVLLATRTGRSGTSARSRRDEPTLERALALGGRRHLSSFRRRSRPAPGRAEDWPQLDGPVRRARATPTRRSTKLNRTVPNFAVSRRRRAPRTRHVESSRWSASTTCAQRAELLGRLRLPEHTRPPTTVRSSSYTRTRRVGSSSADVQICEPGLPALRR